MGQAWYFTQNGQQAGPVEWGQLQQMAAQGQIGAADLVWNDGMPQWVAASTVPGLLPGAPVLPHPSVPSPYAAPASPSPYGADQGAYAGQAPLSYYTPQPGHLIYAGFWLRFVAAFIDGIIVMVISIPVIVVMGLAVGFDSLFDQRRGDIGAQLLMRLICAVIAWLYFALQESSAAQATVGKRAMGLRVTDAMGQRIGFGQATGRYFGKIVSSLICCVGYMMAGWTQHKQALHDMMAGCLVVSKN